jgi:hypothetical protein
MKKLAKVLLIFLSIFLLKENAFANFSRQTSFEERQNCEAENNAIWREFGNSCGDSCEAKVNEFKICDNSLYLGCDCGKNRCWNGAACVLISKYKAEFDEKLAKEQRQTKEEKEARKQEFEAFRQARTKELIKNNEGRAMSIDIEGAANNYADAYKDILDDIRQSQVVAQAANGVENAKQNLQNNQNKNEPLLPTSPPILNENNPNAHVPPAYLKQYESQQQKKQQEQLPLPVIPLPQ